MTYHVRISAQAYLDLDEILEWISRRAPVSAARWQAAILESIESLDQNPQRYEIIEEAQKLGQEVRHYLFGKRRNVFRVLFTIDGDTVVVRHVRRASRDFMTADEW